MVIGWDIGGVNTKIARVVRGAAAASMAHPFELQRAPDRLVPLLRELAARVGAVHPDESFPCAATMTAELSQMFRRKADGVAFVVDALEAAFPNADVRIFSVRGDFLSPGEARRRPLEVAAANWAATAAVVARRHRDALVIDVGTTTTDIIPIAGGVVAAIGLTDPDRLASGELVYSGAVRTPVEAIVDEVPLGDGSAGVSAEGFALVGDVHVWRGELPPSRYTAPTPDGRPPAREFAGERIARIVCGDRDMLDDEAISRIADAVASRQVEQIARAIERVMARHPSLRTAVVTGVGAFIADGAARAAGLDVVPLAETLGDDAAECAPAAAVAMLLENEMRGGDVRPVAAAGTAGEVTRHKGAPRGRPEDGVPECHAPADVDIVVKVGGSLVGYPDHLDRVLRTIAEASRHRRILIVAGGGPFADAVREVDRRIGLADTAAHWMAVAAMDQYAYLLASRAANAVVVDDRGSMHSALAGGRVPVLAPSRMVRAADPLPHSWNVTSDSIAAWVAGVVGAPALILVKPPGVTGRQAVDAWFSHALPAGVVSAIVAADDMQALAAALSGLTGKIANE